MDYLSKELNSSRVGGKRINCFCYADNLSPTSILFSWHGETMWRFVIHVSMVLRLNAVFWGKICQIEKNIYPAVELSAGDI